MPPANEVAEIEAATEKKACVGSLNRWHRIFTFQKRGSKINKNIISVAYIEAGHRGLQAGREISEPDWGMMIDDNQYRVAFGEYDRTARRFVEWSCGCNFPPYDVDHQIECPALGS